jgi:5-formyltetrahydrofolate cyclo-ligase
MTAVPPLTKTGIRKQLLAQRGQLSAAVRFAHSAAITKRLLHMPEYRQADTVLGYMNFGAEFASELWVRRVLADGKKLALPRVNHHTSQLDLYRVEDIESQLAVGLWGIREPIVERCERLAMINEVEFALLPGVAFTRNGTRLGYGRGFYDKLLMKPLAIRLGEQTALHSHSAKSPKYGDISRWLTLAKSLVMARKTNLPALVAAAFELQIVEQIPQESTDVKVEWIITERETIACSENGKP